MEFTQKASLSQTLAKMMNEEPLKWNLVVQVMESKTIKAAFTDKGKAETLRLVCQELDMKKREEAIIGFLEKTWTLKNSLFDHINEELLSETLQESFDENYGQYAIKAWGEDADWTIDSKMLTKVEDLVNHPAAYAFANLEVTTRAKVAQQNDGTSEEDLALSGNTYYPE